jgi:hypothetical protein
MPGFGEVALAISIFLDAPSVYYFGENPPGDVAKKLASFQVAG